MFVAGISDLIHNLLLGINVLVVGQLLLEPAVGPGHLVHPPPLPSVGSISPLSDNFLRERTDPGSASP